MHNNMNATSISTRCSFKYLALEKLSFLQGLFLESLLPSCGPTNGSDHPGTAMLQKPVYIGKDIVLLQ